jgi:hypothetical protein
VKKFVILMMAGLLVAFAANALAGGESQVYYMDEAGMWQVNPPDVNDQLARLFRTGDFTLDSCNKAYWEIPVYVRAHIAQWVKFRLDWNTWEWYVRKPGCYAGNSIEAVVWSNGDIEVGYADFGKLMPMDPDNADHNPVDIYYSYGESIEQAEGNGWVPAEELNQHTDLILDVEPWDLHYGMAFKLWSKICVIACNSACDYYDDAFITITLREQKPWIVWETGEWGI